MTHDESAGNRPVAHLRALLTAVALFVWLIAFVHGCGNDDLIFPGEVPFTPTSRFTATPEPTDDGFDEDSEV